MAVAAMTGACAAVTWVSGSSTMAKAGVAGPPAPSTRSSPASSAKSCSRSTAAGPLRCSSGAKQVMKG